MKNLMLIALFLSANFFAINMINAQCKSSHGNGKAVKTSYSEHHRTIVDIAVDSDVHTTLVAALKAADLVETLKGKGAFYCIRPHQCRFCQTTCRNR